MGNLEQLLEKSAAIASDTIPAGGGGGEGASVVMQIFEANKGKYLTGKLLKKLFEDEGFEIKAVSNILFALRKAGKIEKVQTGVYTLPA